MAESISVGGVVMAERTRADESVRSCRPLTRYQLSVSNELLDELNAHLLSALSLPFGQTTPNAECLFIMALCHRTPRDERREEIACDPAHVV